MGVAYACSQRQCCGLSEAFDSKPVVVCCERVVASVIADVSELMDDETTTPAAAETLESDDVQTLDHHVINDLNSVPTTDLHQPVDDSLAHDDDGRQICVTRTKVKPIHSKHLQIYPH